MFNVQPQNIIGNIMIIKTLINAEKTTSKTHRLAMKAYCFIIRYDMHYSDQSDIVFIYFLSITFHHPNLNYSLGNDTADFHAFPKIFFDLNGP